MIDQSPIAFDEVIFSDLTRAHAGLLDTQVIYGSGASGQVLGTFNTPGITTIPLSALTIQGIYSAIANAIQTVLTTRYLPPECVVMAPRRWAWLLSLLDNQNRPLFVPAAGGPWNAAGVLEDVDSQQVVGQVAGLPVVTDPNITTTAGTKTRSTSHGSPTWSFGKAACAPVCFPRRLRHSRCSCRRTRTLLSRLAATRNP